MALGKRKILGQRSPNAASLSTWYTVPNGKQTTASTLTVCNRSSLAGTFRVSVARFGAADSVEQYLYSDQPLRGNRTFAATIGMTLAATDVVRCYSSNGLMSFNLFGAEADA